jgi:hypothetical protein
LRYGLVAAIGVYSPLVVRACCLLVTGGEPDPYNILLTKAFATPHDCPVRRDARQNQGYLGHGY